VLKLYVLNQGRVSSFLFLNQFQVVLLNHESAYFVLLAIDVSIILKIVSHQNFSKWDIFGRSTYICPANNCKALLAKNIPDKVETCCQMFLFLGSVTHIHTEKLLSEYVLTQC